MLVKNMAYSSISLNHIQQKKDLLTTAVIRKRRRWTANMAVAWIASSGEHFCCFLPSLFFLSFFLLFFPLFFFFFSFFFSLSLSLREKYSWDILNAILCHKYHPNHSDRARCCERRQHLEIWARTRYIFFADVSSWEACTVTGKLDPDLMSERGIRTVKNKNMEQNSPFVLIVGFVRFV